MKQNGLNLSNIVEVMNQNQDNNTHKKLIWNNIWQVLKKITGKEMY